MAVVDLGPFDSSEWQMRVGRLGNRPLVAIVSEARAVLLDAGSGDMLADIQGQEATHVLLDIAIERDGAWLLERIGSAVSVRRLVGTADPEVFAVPGSNENAEFPGALRVLDGQVHALVGPGDLMYLGPDGTEPCVRSVTTEVGYAENIDLIAVPVGFMGSVELYAGYGCEAPSFVGGQQLGHRDWFAWRLKVRAGDIENDPVNAEEHADVWTGSFGERPVVAFGSDNSIQVRDLADGHMVAVRMTGDGTTLQDYREVHSVAFCGDLVALNVEGQLEVRRWDDFSVVQVVDFPWIGHAGGHARVRLVEANGEVWLVASDQWHVWSAPVRFPRPLRTYSSPIPRAWRRLSVAPDGLLVAGLDEQRGVWALGYERYQRIMNREDVVREEPFVKFRLSAGPCSAVSLGERETFHPVTLTTERWVASGFAVWAEDQFRRAETRDDPVMASIAGLELAGHRSGGVTRIGAAPDSVPRWRERDEITHMQVPHLWGPRRDHRAANSVVVVVLDRHRAEAGTIVLREPSTGANLAEALLPWISDLDAVWAGPELLIAAVTDLPHGLVCFRWSGGKTFEKVLDLPGVRSRSVALCAGVEGLALAYVAGGVCHVIDPTTGAPLGDATPTGDFFVVVDGPFGTRFLLGDEVHALPPQGYELAWTPPPFTAGDLRMRDREADWLKSLQAQKQAKGATAGSARRAFSDAATAAAWHRVEDVAAAEAEPNAEPAGSSPATVQSDPPIP